MVKVKSKALNEEIEVGRKIGEYSTGVEGPGLFVTAGVHGNEPSGIYALKRIFEQLEKDKPPMKGKFVGVTGNMPALEEEKRFINHDMNRICKFKTVTELQNSDTYKLSEGKQLEEVMRLAEDFKNDPLVNEQYFIDCHTTSSVSKPYISAHDFDHSIAFASKMPVYTVTGLGKAIPGTMDDYLNSIGFTGFTFEAGQHDALESIDNHEAIIWLTLAAAGCIEKEAMGCYPTCESLLKKTVLEGKKHFEVLYRYAIHSNEAFEMEPGYVNFQEVKKGEVLAKNEEHKILSDWDARILMPLYQKQGNDGFFIVKEVMEEKVV